ncbi:MAG: D-glycerate dehydrogenase [Planctomycetes bacterium]|nr:D-glycerate dehydrogenase [Planctomycetota bacterium]
MPEDRVVITRPLPGDPVARLRDAGFENVWINPDDVRLERAPLLTAVAGARAVIATPADAHVNAEFFDAAGDQLAVVSNFAVGVDNVDLPEAERRGVVIANTPNAVTEPTADVAWLLMLGAARRVYEGETLVRSGAWGGIGPNELLGRRVIGKTLFIVGAGRIGLATARRSIGWEMPVLYHARTRHEEFECPPVSATRVTLEEGLRRADFVSIHTPLTDETHHLIDAERLALMRPDAVLVNTARGPIVDEAALAAALAAGRLGAAGLDVYEAEPALHPDLPALKNVFLLPHLGSATVEDRQWMMRLAVDNAVCVLTGQPPLHAVVG